MILFGIIGYASFAEFIGNFLDTYLTFVERIANWFLQLFNSAASIHEHRVYIDGEVAYLHEYIGYKKWALALLILCWITPTLIRKKLFFTVMILLVNFTGSVMDVGFTSHFISVAPDVYSAELMGRSPHFLLILSLLTA